MAQMKITTKDALNGYGILKELKVSTLSDKAMMGIWKDIKTLRPIHEEWQKDIEEVAKTLQDEEYTKMQTRLQNAQQREAKVNAKEYTLTEDDKKDIADINAYFAAFNEKSKQYLEELGSKEHEVDICKVGDEELLKAMKASDKGFAEMEVLEWLVE